MLGRAVLSHRLFVLIDASMVTLLKRPASSLVVPARKRPATAVLPKKGIALAPELHVSVVLPSGRTLLENFGVRQEDDCLHLTQTAQRALGRLLSSLIAPSGCCLHAGIKIKEASLADGDVLTGIVAPMIRIYSTDSIFVAVKHDNTVVEWGERLCGGCDAVQQQLLQGVQHIYSTDKAFAALTACGSVITWGSQARGGNSLAVREQLRDSVHYVASSRHGRFAALKHDGSVVLWGRQPFKSNCENSWGQLTTDVQKVFFTHDGALAVIKCDGSSHIETQGDSYERPVPADWGVGTQNIVSSGFASAAIKSTGHVVTWGDMSNGGDSQMVQSELSEKVQAVFCTDSAFAALKSDGSVVTWGAKDRGGDSAKVQNQLTSIRDVAATCGAFAALSSNGSVMTWGHKGQGGDSSQVKEQLLNEVQHIHSTRGAFVAVKTGGSVVAWGSQNWGGDIQSVRKHVKGGVHHVCATDYAFAAIKGDGSVVTWGNCQRGGDCSEVKEQLATEVVSLA